MPESIRVPLSALQPAAPGVIRVPVSQLTAAAQEPDFRSSNEKDASGAPVVRQGPVGEFLTEATASLNPLNWAKAAKAVVTDPMAVAQSMYEGRTALSDAALDAFSKGDYVRGTAKAIEWLIPFVGERMSQAGDLMEQGEWARGLGATVDAAGQVAGPAAVRRLTPPKVTAAPLRNVNPAEQAAVEFGMREDIPVDAATASGNRFVRGVQRLADESFLGSGVSARATQRQGDALAATGRRLMDRVAPAAVTTEQAGEAVRGGVTVTVRRFAGEADTAYTALRAIEAKQPGVRVGLLGVKTALKPVYQRLRREAELVPLQGGKARALTALDRLMNGPDSGWLSDVDAALGDLKALARAEIPELRTQGQGLAAVAVKELERTVQSTAARLGPQAVRALREGRQATIAKHAAGEILESLRQEPVGVFNQATAARDAGIGLLRELQKYAPNELPKVGRAVLEELLTKATREGGFNRAQGLYADWGRLGAGTKRLLFRDAALVKDLDSFFLLAKKAAENPNPSGTALTLSKGGEMTLLFNQPVTGAAVTLGAPLLSKLLHSPRVVRALNRGLTTPAKNKAASLAAVVEVMAAAREAGVRVAPAADREGRAASGTPARPTRP